MLVVWLVCCIISAVGNLLSVITTGIWLDHLSKMKDRTGLVNGLSGFMLLASVAVGSNKVYSSIFTSNIAGVCFILTAVMICHYWNSNSPKYQAVGKIAVSIPFAYLKIIHIPYLYFNLHKLCVS